MEGLVQVGDRVPRGVDGNGPFLATIAEACALHTAHVTPALDWSRLWITVRDERERMPGQGWKLHLSASARSAEQVLRRALPIVLAENVAFKVAASIRALSSLNDGSGGLSQIGKFVTVYPRDDAQAVRLAVALDEATQGLHGPSIPSDRPFVRGSLVHYRYGNFDGRHLQTPLGEIVPAIVTPDGVLAPDSHLPVYRPPEWATDPFVAAGVATDLPASEPLVGGRFLVVSTLHESPRGAVYLVVDTATPRRCVLKRARREAGIGTNGADARDRLRHEAAVLARLQPDERFPAAFDLFEQDGDLFLAMEDVEGETLEERVTATFRSGGRVPVEQLLRWARELADALDAIHRHGLAYRDLKSANVVVTPQGQLRLLDFDIAAELGAESGVHGRGSRGYMSPQQYAGEPPSVADDVYGLGALLYFAASGAEPSLAPHPARLLDRPLALMNPAVGRGLERVIARCLDPEPDERYRSMAALAAALETIGDEASARKRPAEVGLESEATARERCREQARRLGDTLCATAWSSPMPGVPPWLGAREDGGDVWARDLNSGSAGPALALAELVRVFGVPDHVAMLEEAAERLTEPPPASRSLLPGLYVGEAGVGAALLRAGQVLGDEELIEAAAERGRSIASLPHASPDLFHGTAGRLRFHLFLWDETGDPQHRRAALAAGESLLASAEHAGLGGLRWPIPAGYDGLSARSYLGYAHGAAGIADSLLDLFEATGDGRFLETARGAEAWLARLAVPALEDGSGLAWPSEADGKAVPAWWCHGATGIGRYFLHAARLAVSKEAAELAKRAARTVADGAKWVGPTQCHGLAGNIEFLLDMFQATDDRAYLTEARSQARLLESFAAERDGLLVWTTVLPTTATPDYMVGYSGVAMCLLRLAEPEVLPTQLSRSGFRAGRNKRLPERR